MSTHYGVNALTLRLKTDLLFLSFLFLFLFSHTLGHATGSWPHLQLGLSGSTIVYQQYKYKNIQDTAPRKRWVTDLERLSFEAEAQWHPRLELETEIEIEHGGSGTALEFDGYEEFGEFETEIEQGGEVKIDKLELTYKGKNWLNFHGGFIGVPVGLAYVSEHPTDYYSVFRAPSESKIIPVSWRQIGLGLSGERGYWSYRYALMEGLNSEFFRKYAWISQSAKRRFETNFSDHWAQAIRLDYGFTRDHRLIGLSIYYGNTTGARHKPGLLTEDAPVFIADIHFLYSWNKFKIRALYLRGFLKNSHSVARANSSLPGIANPGGFSSLGSQADAAFLEFGWDPSSVLPSFLTPSSNLELENNSPEYHLILFIRFDHWDTMRAVPANTYPDPRFQENSITIGWNLYIYDSNLIFKTNYSIARRGLPELPTQHQIALGLAFALYPRKGASE